MSSVLDELEEDKVLEVSDLQVLRSNAGYYIGTTYRCSWADGLPYSRDSEYYSTRESAQATLDQWSNN